MIQIHTYEQKKAQRGSIGTCYGNSFVCDRKKGSIIFMFMILWDPVFLVDNAFVSIIECKTLLKKVVDFFWLGEGGDKHL